MSSASESRSGLRALAGRVPALVDAIPGSVMVVLVALYAVLFATPYWQHVINNSLVYVILAVSLYVALGLGGLVSFGHAAFFAVGGYAVALLTTQRGWDFWPTVLVAVVAGAVAGVLAGLPSLRVSGHYLALVTLGAAVCLQSVLKNWTEVTQGNDGVAGIPGIPIFGQLSFSEGDYAWILAVGAILAILVVALIEHSRMGRRLRTLAVGEQFAEMVGVPTARVKVLGFAMSGAIAAVGGALYAPWQGYVDPSMSSMSVTILVLIYLAAGGASRLSGAVVGALVLAIVHELFRFAGDGRTLVFMVLAAVILLVAPDGIVGRYDAIRQRLRSRGSSTTSEEVPA